MNNEWKKDGLFREKDMCRIQILTMEEFQNTYPAVSRRIWSTGGMGQVRLCKAECLPQAVAGTFAVPEKKDPDSQKDVFGYCLMEDRLVFVDDGHFVSGILEDMSDYSFADCTSPALVFFDFMEYMLKDDMFFLLECEEKLMTFEDELFHNIMSDFQKNIFSMRRHLSVMGTYYEQLSDIGETLRQEAEEKGDERIRRMFGFYCDKVLRLLSTVKNLQEYSIQLREMHQTQVDMRQNEIMKILTIVTTIFMPLTLIAGWYGMNFVNMPELSDPHGYAIVCGACLIIIGIEIWIFKIRKWFH